MNSDQQLYSQGVFGKDFPIDRNDNKSNNNVKTTSQVPISNRKSLQQYAGFQPLPYSNLQTSTNLPVISIQAPFQQKHLVPGFGSWAKLSSSANPKKKRPIHENCTDKRDYDVESRIKYPRDQKSQSNESQSLVDLQNETERMRGMETQYKLLCKRIDELIQANATDKFLIEQRNEHIKQLMDQISKHDDFKIWNKYTKDENILHKASISRDFESSITPGSSKFLFSNGEERQSPNIGQVKSYIEILKTVFQMEGSGSKNLSFPFGNVMVNTEKIFEELSPYKVLTSEKQSLAELNTYLSKEIILNYADETLFILLSKVDSDFIEPRDKLFAKVISNETLDAIDKLQINCITQCHSLIGRYANRLQDKLSDIANNVMFNINFLCGASNPSNTLQRILYIELYCLCNILAHVDNEVRKNINICDDVWLCFNKYDKHINIKLASAYIYAYISVGNKPRITTINLYLKSIMYEIEETKCEIYLGFSVDMIKKIKKKIGKK